jgi:hypothetical protein
VINRLAHTNVGMAAARPNWYIDEKPKKRTRPEDASRCDVSQLHSNTSHISLDLLGLL